MRQGVEIAWVETRITLFLARKRPYCTRLNKYVNTQSYVFLIYAFLSQDTTTRQINRVQRRISEPYEHHCLKDNIEKKIRTFRACCLCYCVFPHAFRWYL